MTSRFLVPSIDLAPGDPSQYAVVFNGSTTIVNCGSDSSLDDLAVSGDFSADGWFLSSSINTTKVLMRKTDGSTGGWQIYQLGTGKLGAFLWASGGGLYYPTAAQMNGSIWHHVVLFHDASELKMRLAVDGTWLGYSNAYTGTPNADAAQDLILSTNTTQSWEGKMAWARISNNDRFGGASGTSFTPPAKDAPPEIDANTIEQWNLNEGSGSTTAAQVNSPASDGTITDGAWETL